MAQALKYWDGANPKIYVILTQKEGGGWHLACHWTDRILEYDCELVEDCIGQHLRYGSGSILPLRNNKGQLYARWSEATDHDINDRPTPKEQEPVVEEKTQPDEEPLAIVEEKPKEARYDNSAELERLKEENEALKAHIAETAKEPQAARYDVITESQIKESRNQEINESRNCKGGNGQKVLKAVGTVAAMSVALFVIWQTGLLIPLGLIGLVTSGILK